MFDLRYFKKHQKILLFLCNNFLLKYWFRWILRIHKDLKFSEKIISLEPNNYKVSLGSEIRVDFRTHNKFSKRMFYAFKYYWYFRHYLDNVIHFVRSLFLLPKLQLAYDTLTAYPEPYPASTAGDVVFASGDSSAKGITWANIYAGTGDLGTPPNLSTIHLLGTSSDLPHKSYPQNGQ